MNEAKNEALQRLVEIIETVLLKVTNDTDVVMAGYDSPLQLRSEMTKDLQALKSGILGQLKGFQLHFSPTSTYQELAFYNGWVDEYLLLAEEFDPLCRHVLKGH